MQDNHRSPFCSSSLWVDDDFDDGDDNGNDDNDDNDGDKQPFGPQKSSQRPPPPHGPQQSSPFPFQPGNNFLKFMAHKMLIKWSCCFLEKVSWAGSDG